MGALIVGALPTLMWTTFTRRVRVGRDVVEVSRGLRPFPRRYPRSAESRIVQLDTMVYLARAGQFRLFNVTLSPTLASAEEARWVAWELRRGLAETV